MAPSATNTAIEDEIVTLETAYWDSMKNNDLEGSLELTHDPCIVTGAQGAAMLDHAAMRAMYEKKTWQLQDYKIDNLVIQTVNDNVASLGYTIRLEMEVEGKTSSMDFAESSAWVKRDGDWVCLLHSESPIGDPFGRDKQKK